VRVVSALARGMAKVRAAPIKAIRRADIFRYSSVTLLPQQYKNDAEWGVHPSFIVDEAKAQRR
jgi:hypothetical protein